MVGTGVGGRALSVAKSNAVRLVSERRIQFLESNLYEALGPEFKGHFDMIVSNPPYISSSERTFLDPEVQTEPPGALFGGPDGLNVINPLIEQSRIFLKPDGHLLLEIGFQQGERVKSLMEKHGFASIETRQDYSGHDRMISGQIS